MSMLRSSDFEMILLGVSLLQKEKPKIEWENILKQCQKDDAGLSTSYKFIYIIRKNSIKVYRSNK